MQLQKLGHRAATAGARESRRGGKNGAGSHVRPAVATVPPPRTRQPVGAGGVNAHDDLLQAQRNLARLGYAPPVAGIGESTESRSVAVRNGLLAYQQAKGLKTDGRMDPDGATERQLHRQIQVQQKILKKQVQVDAKRAANDLAGGGAPGASGAAESTAARTLGARMTGAKVEAAQKQAYTEALDRMKRGMADATARSGAEAGAPATAATGSVAKADGEIRIDERRGSGTAPSPASGKPVAAPGGTGGNRSAAAQNQPAAGTPADTPASPRKPADATAGAEKKRPQGNTDRAIARALARRDALRAKALERAETRKHAGLGDIEHEADRRGRQRAADAAFRAGTRSIANVTETMLRGLDIAVERGAVPQQVRPWLERLGGLKTRTVSDSGLSHRYLAVLDRLARLHERRPAVFETLPLRLRTAVAVHRHIGDTQGSVDTDDGSAAGLEAIKRRSGLIESTVHDLHKPGGLKTLGFVADWLPVIGEFKSGVETLIALRNYAAARERGDSEAATRYAEEAGWGFVGLVPLLGYSRKGRKLLRQLATPVGKLSVKAGDAFARKIEEAVARHRPKRGNQDKPEDLPDNFEQGPKRELSERLAARRKVAILKRDWNDDSIQGLDVPAVFGRSLKDMTPEEQKTADFLVKVALGRAAERTVNRTMRDAGFSTAVRGSGRSVRNSKTNKLRRYDIGTTDRIGSVFGLFLLPKRFKGAIENDKITVIEVKSGGSKSKSGQKATDKEVEAKADSDSPKKIVNRKKDTLLAVDIGFFRIPTHKIDKDDAVASLKKTLTREYGARKAGEFVRDFEAFRRRSTTANPIPVGIVLLYLAGRMHRLDDDE